MTPEGEVKNAIAEYLERLPGIWFTYSQMNKPSRGRRRNSPREKSLLDITGWWTINSVAVVFMVEVKAPGGERREVQVKLVNECLKAGGFACFAESVDELHAKMKAFRLTKEQPA